jgi:hypothetical protein
MRLDRVQRSVSSAIAALLRGPLNQMAISAITNGADIRLRVNDDQCGSRSAFRGRLDGDAPRT